MDPSQFCFHWATRETPKSSYKEEVYYDILLTQVKKNENLKLKILPTENKQIRNKLKY